MEPIDSRQSAEPLNWIDAVPVQSCTRCGYDSKWTIINGLCTDCRAADQRTLPDRK